MRRAAGEPNFGLVRASIHTARELYPEFGREMVSSEWARRLLERWNVEIVLEELPAQKAAMLSPLLLGRFRTLSLATHVPIAARRMVLLHESGHLYQETATVGYTYDPDDWQSPAEAGADLFAAIGLIPKALLDAIAGNCATLWEIEDAVADNLEVASSGLWPAERTVHVARNRLRARSELGV